MTDDRTIKLEISEGVASITFARPKHNVFNIDMMNAFCRVLQEVNQDDTLKCVVIYGEGSSWCAGVDVGDHKPDMAPAMAPSVSRSPPLMMAQKRDSSNDWG